MLGGLILSKLSLECQTRLTFENFAFFFKWLEQQVHNSLSLLWLLNAFLIYAYKCVHIGKECALVHWQHISSGCCVYLSRLRGGSLRLKHIKVSKAFLWVGVLQS